MTESQNLSPNNPDPKNSFWAELRRRKVVRVAVTYAVVAWLLIQVTSIVFPQFGIPDWGARFVTLLLMIGFPVALILAWAFELTPDGIKTTKHAREEQGDVPVSEKQERERNWFSLIFAAAVPTVIFGALAVFFYFRSGGVLEAEAAEKSIAVLPLTNMSPDPGNGFFADGVHEDVLTNLSRIKELMVIGRTSTLQYRDTVKTLQQIGEELGVRYLVEGSVRRARNHVLVTVQLIDAQTEGHLWAESYSRELDDIFAIQSEIAQEIAQQLRAKISPSEMARIEKRPTSNQTAYDLFVKARDLDRSSGSMRPSPSEFEQIIHYLQAAVSLDPEFASAYALMSSTFSHRITSPSLYENYSETIKQARDAVEKAEALDPTLPEVHLAWGNYYYYGFLDYARAAEEYFAAMALQPGSAEAYRRLGVIQRRQGREKEAMETFEKALAYDPRDPNLLSNLVYVYTWFRRYRLAESCADRLLNLDPDNPRFRWLKEEISFFRDGDIDHRLNAINLFPARNWYPETDATETSDGNLAKIYYQSMKGDFAAALAVAESMEISVDNPESSWQKPWAVAKLEWLLGDHEKSKEAAKEAVKALESLQKTTMLPYFQHSQTALMYAILGDAPQVEQYRKKAVESLVGTRDEVQQRYSVKKSLLPSYLILGETEEALAILDEVLSQPSNAHAAEMRVDPFWRSFNGDPRFEAILAKAKSVD